MPFEKSLISSVSSIALLVLFAGSSHSASCVSTALGHETPNMFPHNHKSEASYYIHSSSSSAAVKSSSLDEDPPSSVATRDISNTKHEKKEDSSGDQLRTPTNDSNNTNAYRDGNNKAAPSFDSSNHFARSSSFPPLSQFNTYNSGGSTPAAATTNTNGADGASSSSSTLLIYASQLEHQLDAPFFTTGANNAHTNPKRKMQNSIDEMGAHHQVAERHAAASTSSAGTTHRRLLQATTTTTATAPGAVAAAFSLDADYQINITVCSNVYWAPYQSHLDFAARNYPDLKAQFWPNINVVGVPLAFTTAFVSEDDIQTTIGVVRSWIREDGDSKCDLFIGPSISDTAIAMSPLMERSLWVDYGASSTQLGNKATYPSFLRTIPSDEQGAPKVAELLNYFNWRNIFLIKGDNSYATTWAAAVIAAHTANGGAVVRTYNTVGSTITEALLTSILLEIKAANTESRVVVVVGVDYELMNVVFQKYHLDKDLIVVFSEEPCSNSMIDWGKVNGAFCLATGYDQDRYDAYMRNFSLRGELEFNNSIQPLLALGYPYEYLLSVRDDNDVYGSLGVDSLWFGLTVLQAYAETHNGQIDHDSAALAAFAMSGNVSFPYGLTGEVSVNSEGDRSNVIASLYNSGADNGTAVVGQVDTDGQLEVHGDRPLASDTTTSSPSADRIFYMLGQTYDLRGLSRGDIIALIPTDRVIIPVYVKEQQPVYIWIIIALVLAFLAIALAVIGYVMYQRSKRGWATRHAPKSEADPIAVIFTDIQSSTALWAECPQEMVAALDLHNAIIRACIAAHRGYEVKTIGDSFMVAFKSPLDAVNCSLSIQKALFEANWNDDSESDTSSNNKKGGHGNKDDTDANPNATGESDGVDVTDEDPANAASVNNNKAATGAQATINNFYECFIMEAAQHRRGTAMGFDEYIVGDDEEDYADEAVSAATTNNNSGGGGGYGTINTTAFHASHSVTGGGGTVEHFLMGTDYMQQQPQQYGGTTDSVVAVGTQSQHYTTSNFRHSASNLNNAFGQSTRGGGVVGNTTTTTLLQQQHHTRSVGPGSVGRSAGGGIGLGNTHDDDDNWTPEGSIVATERTAHQQNGAESHPNAAVGDDHSPPQSPVFVFNNNNNNTSGHASGGSGGLLLNANFATASVVASVPATLMVTNSGVFSGVHNRGDAIGRTSSSAVTIASSAAHGLLGQQQHHRQESSSFVRSSTMHTTHVVDSQYDTNDGNNNINNPHAAIITNPAKSGLFNNSRSNNNNPFTALEAQSAFHNGLRVRVGGAFGFVSIRRTARDGIEVTAAANGKGGRKKARQNSKNNNVNGDSNSSPSALDDDDCVFDYFGSTVNMAARIEAIGHGGQVLISKALLDAAEAEAAMLSPPTPTSHPASSRTDSATNNNVDVIDSAEKYIQQQTTTDGAGDGKNFTISTTAAPRNATTKEGAKNNNAADATPLELFERIVKTSLGRIDLRGLTDAVDIIQITCEQFAPRTFPPPRLDKGGEGGGGGGAGGGGGGLGGDDEDFDDAETTFTGTTANTGNGGQSQYSASVAGELRSVANTAAGPAAGAPSINEGGGGSVLAAPSSLLVGAGGGVQTAASSIIMKGMPPPPPSPAGPIVPTAARTLDVVSVICRKRKLKEADIRMSLCVIEAQFSILQRADANAIYKSLFGKWRIEYKREAQSIKNVLNAAASHYNNKNNNNLANPTKQQATATVLIPKLDPQHIKALVFAIKITPNAIIRYQKHHLPILAATGGGVGATPNNKNGGRAAGGHAVGAFGARFGARSSQYTPSFAGDTSSIATGGGIVRGGGGTVGISGLMRSSQSIYNNNNNGGGSHHRHAHHHYGAMNSGLSGSGSIATTGGGGSMSSKMRQQQLLLQHLAVSTHSQSLGGGTGGGGSIFAPSPTNLLGGAVGAVSPNFNGSNSRGGNLISRSNSEAPQQQSNAAAGNNNNPLCSSGPSVSGVGDEEGRKNPEDSKIIPRLPSVHGHGRDSHEANNNNLRTESGALSPLMGTSPRSNGQSVGK